MSEPRWRWLRRTRKSGGEARVEDALAYGGRVFIPPVGVMVCSMHHRLGDQELIPAHREAQQRRREDAQARQRQQDTPSVVVRRRRWFSEGATHALLYDTCAVYI
jgi:hypothetical protein